MKLTCLIFIVLGLTIIQGLHTERKFLFKQSLEAPPAKEPAEKGAANTTGKPDLSQIKKLNITQQPALIFEGWLKLASQQFTDAEKFPDLALNDNKYSKVEVLYGAISTTNTIVQTGSKTQGRVFYRKNKNFGLDKEIPSQDSFYFRISGLNAYYTETKKDMTVLGAIQIKNIYSTKMSAFQSDQCFTIENSEYDKWNMCAKDLAERHLWMCAIQEAQGMPCDAKVIMNNVTTIKEVKLKKQPYFLIPMASPYCNEDWNYLKKGYEWECKCREGRKQSPIQLGACSGQKFLYTSADFIFNNVSLDSLSLNYQENIIRLETSNKLGFGRVIDYDMDEYIAKEIHIHTPAEHQISVERGDMELQVIFEPIGDTSMRSKVILAFVVTMKAGVNNMFLDIIDPLDLPTDEIQRKQINVKEGRQSSISVQSIFQEDDQDEALQIFNYYYYEGSQTAPPCNEEVKWFVVDEKITWGFTAMEMLKKVVSEIPPSEKESDSAFSEVQKSNPLQKEQDGNNRAFQQLNGREVQYYDKTKDKCHSYKDNKDKNKDDSEMKGHYEKVESKQFTYLYVDGQKMSGLNNTVKVSQEEAFGQVEAKKSLSDKVSSFVNGVGKKMSSFANKASNFITGKGSSSRSSSSRSSSSSSRSSSSSSSYSYGADSQRQQSGGSNQGYKY